MVRIVLSLAVATLASVAIHTTFTTVTGAVADVMRPFAVGAVVPR